MRFSFIPMTGDYARLIVENWKYPNEYAIYDYTHEADHMLESDGWGRGIFAVLDENGELVAELSIEFFDENGQYTDYLEFGDQTLINTRQLWIGFGLRPDLVGQGMGAEFVTACLEYALAQSGYRGEYARLGVAKFNQRAIRAYQKAGFQIYDQTVGDIAGQQFECVYMQKSL